MRYRKLGKTNIEVSEISLGCWTLGGLNWVNGEPNGWANVDEPAVKRAVDYALEHGVNHFDNADVYGNGRAERMLGRLLGRRSKEVVIASKVGHFQGTAAHAYEPAHIRQQCEQSLINLGRDYLDIYYFHHGDFGVDDVYLDDALAVMQELKQQGKIRLLGLSAYSSKDFVRLVDRVNPDVLQSWAHALDTQFIEPSSPVRRLLDERGISFVAFSPLAQGLLLGKYKPGHATPFERGDHRRESAQFSDANLQKVGPKLDRLTTAFGAGSAKLARVALQYLLSYPCVGCVIPGFRNLEQVRLNLEGADAPLSEAEVTAVRRALAD